MSEFVAGTFASNSSTIQTTASGRTATRAAQSGQGRNGNRGERGNRCRNNRGNGGNNSGASRTLFKGNMADMNAHVFECYEERGD
jgi:hypothetical protein